MNLALLLWALALSFLSANVEDPLYSSALEADRIVSLRREGPPALARLCALYDTLPAGEEKDDLEREIDGVAAQRYATIARLFWYTDLELAKTSARAAGKPILSLRMLGRLDEDLSCANSRFFRVVLYADPEVSAFLRENFILHWSSERVVPKVTIDYGGGRRIQTTLAGNSAHYVLDADGRALDILPGLYSPKAFRQSLEELMPLALASPTLGDSERARRVAEQHRRSESRARELWSPAVPTTTVPRPREPGIVGAELLTVSKAVPEMRTLGALTGGRLVAIDRTGARRLDEALLSPASRALLARLAPSDWSDGQRPASAEDLATIVAIFEGEIARDTEINELRLRPQAHGCFLEGEHLRAFAVINQLVYANVFLTPADDAWLGLANPFVFSGLQNDGISGPAAFRP